MKVLFVSLLTYDKIGGIETFNKYFIESLKTNNIEIVVVSYHDKNSFDNVIACNSSLFVLVKSIFREMEATDIIVWSHINLLPVFFLFKQLTNSKNVLITHGIEVWYKLSWGKEFMLNRMDYILSVSNYTKDKLVNVCSILPEKVKIFPNCIKLKNKTKQKNPFDKKKFNILTLLRVDESYKLQSIINILNAMDELEDREINFTIIGKGNRLEYIQEEINKRNLSKQVFLKGFIEDTSKYLEHCDVFTLISDREGFGIVYLEAMEYRKPCFSAKNCGSSDVVIDGYNGYSFDMNDIEKLARIIGQLKEDNILKDTLGLNGNKILLEKFTFDRYVDNQKNILEKISKGN